MTAVLELPISIVQAPAGYGKTVAVRAVARDATWVTLSGYEGEPEDLTRLLVTVATPHAEASLGQLLAEARSASDAVELLARWLLRAIKDEPQRPARIVIDDIHVLSGDAAKLLARVAERSSDLTRWTLVGRSSAGLPVSTWIAYGRCALPVGESDLEFTQDEARELLARSGRFDERLTKLVTDLTGGWAAGITFAGVAAARSGDPTVIEAAVRRMSEGFFAEQIIGSLEEHDRTFLTAVSLLAHFDDDVLRELGIPYGEGWIDELRAHGVFIMRDETGALRLHDLLRDALRARAQEQLDSLLALLLPALQKLRRPADALRLARLAGRQDLVVELLRERGFALLDAGYWDLVESAIAALPSGVTRVHPVILGLRGALEASAGRFSRADALFTKALQEEETSSEYYRDTAMRFCVLLVNRSDPRAISLLEGLRFDEPSREADRLAALGAAFATGGQLDSGHAAIDSALRLVKEAEDDVVSVKVNLRAGFVSFYGSKPEEAERFATAAVTHAAELGEFWLAARAASILYAVAYLFREDLAMASWQSQQMALFAEKAGDQQSQLIALHAQYSLEVERGRDERVRAIERNLSDLDASRGFRDSYQLAVARALRESWGGAFDRSIRALTILATDSFAPAQRLAWHATLAMFLAAAGRRAEALTHLNELAAPFTSHEAVSDAYQAQALVHGAIANFIAGRGKIAKRQLGAARFSALYGPIADA
ncbi:MAG: hypothetical protein JO165_12580, partial [Candidatus Eremiobacteraeota bacterium]|nr:hypothetical protein [Candidatus Eremiobacteraeota bacterium]